VDHRSEHRITTAVSVIVRGTDSSGKPFSAPAGVLDYSDSGTRICGLRVTLEPGARIEIESKGDKKPYLVEWIGAEHTLQDGQIGARSLDLGESPAPHPGAYARSGSADSSPAPSVAERRRYPRKVCRIEAQITTDDDAVRLDGKVTDISLDGCYVEMLSPLPSNTLIHTSLALDSGEICATGIIRYAQTGLGMGIEFMAMSPEHFERLRTFAPPGAPGLGAGGPKIDVTSPPVQSLVPAQNGASSDSGAIAESLTAGSMCHLPSAGEALEVVIRILARKGVLTREELSRELESLKTAKV
jgi:PilZ domain-containing protein